MLTRNRASRINRSSVQTVEEPRRSTPGRTTQEPSPGSQIDPNLHEIAIHYDPLGPELEPETEPEVVNDIPNDTANATANENENELETGPNDPPHLSGTQHDIPDEQELRGINEHMKLFWGAVSSAFGEGGAGVAGHGDGDHDDEQGQGHEGLQVDHDIHETEEVDDPDRTEDKREQQEQTDRLDRMDGMDHHVRFPTDEEIRGHDLGIGSSSQNQNQNQDHLHPPSETIREETGMEEATGQEEGDHPRNEWEHVQLLMSLGGQLGTDLAALEGMEGVGVEHEHEQESREVESGKVGPVHRSVGRRVTRSSNRSKPPPSQPPSGPHNNNNDDASSQPPSPRPHPTLPSPPPNPAPKRKGRPPKSKPPKPRKPKDPSTGTSSTRQLLSAAERRANHVSSEQRRRNAIRIGYAELGALVHMNVNDGVWPDTAELEAVIEEGRGMEGMEELTGVRRGVMDLGQVEGGDTGMGADVGVGLEAGLQVPPGEGETDPFGLSAFQSRPSPTSLPPPLPLLAPPVPPKPKKTRKGIHIIGQGMTSKSSILKKGAGLARWLTEGNDWLRSEIERLESLLGIPPGQDLDEYTVGPHGLERAMGEGMDLRTDEEQGHVHAHDDALGMGMDMEMHMSMSMGMNMGMGMGMELGMGMGGGDEQPRIEDHFIQAEEALRAPPEEIGPDGYPRDMY